MAGAPYAGICLYMTTLINNTGIPTIFDRLFNVFYTVGNIQRFQTFNDARRFHLQNIYAGHDQAILKTFDAYDVYICELDASNKLVNETLSGTGTYIQANPQQVVTQHQTQNTNDGIDYLTPGEALKAHKRGKKVDWKRLAEKRG